VTLLTVDDLRKWPEFASTDGDVLQLLLDAAEAAIENALGGPPGALTEVVDGRLSTFLTLRRRVAAIGSIVSTQDGVDTTLATDDYRLAWDRRTVWRLGTGTNAAYRWPSGLVAITYEPEGDEEERKRAQKALVSLDANYAAGLTSEQIGSWMEQHSQSSSDYLDQRSAILASLWPTPELDFA